MQDAQVTIIGGSGFLGRYIIRRLAEAGYRIRILCRHPKRAEALKPAGVVGQIVPDYGDIAKPETLKGKLTGSYAVINLVGLLYESGKQSFVRVHAQGAEKLAQMAMEEKVEAFVQVSALGVDKATQSLYARTKFEGEQAVKEAFPNTTILRPSVIFGAEDNFFNFFARMSLFSPFLPAIGGGKTKFQPVYVDDVARAVVTILNNSHLQGETYELGGPHIYTFSELLTYLGEVTGRKRLQLPIPYAAASMMGMCAQLLPKPPITRDQVRLLQTDNIVSEDAKGFEALGIEPMDLEGIVPDYLAHACERQPHLAA